VPANVPFKVTGWGFEEESKAREIKVQINASWGDARSSNERGAHTDILITGKPA